MTQLLVFLGVVEQTTAVVIPTVDPETLWLMAGGLAGAVLCVLWTKGQKKLGFEALQDCFFGVAIGGLWTVPLFGLWPPFELAPHASYVQRALLMAVVAAIGVKVIKRAAMSLLPAYMEKLLAKDGVALPKKEGNGQ